MIAVVSVLGVEQSSKTEDTFPKLLLRNYQRWGDGGVWMRKKALGIWREYTWKDCYEVVRSLSLGLLSVGLERGGRVAILGDSCPEWFWAELAVQACGGIPIGLYADSLPDEAKHMTEQAQATFVVAEGQEQVDRLQAVVSDLPLLKKIIYWDPKGMSHCSDSLTLSFEDLIGLGREYERTHPGLFEENLLQGAGRDPCMIVYTSGTTGLPKAVILSYDFVRYNNQQRLCSAYQVSEKDEWFSFMLPGWSVEQALGLLNSLLTGQKISFAEGTDTAPQDLREISPTSLVYPSRIWEQLVSVIRFNMSNSSRRERALFNLCLKIGYKLADQKVRMGKAGIFWRFLGVLSESLVFHQLRDRHGLARTKIAYAGGSTLSPDILRFLHGIGLSIRQFYSSSETGVISVQAEDCDKFETLGRLADGACIRIGASGELLVSNSVPFMGYAGDAGSAEAQFTDGWFHTGDVCSIDDNGHLTFIDRLEDMRRLDDGTRFSPQYIEGQLRFSPYIHDAFVFYGEGRQFPGAIVNIDFRNVSNLAERQKMMYSTFVDLSQKPEVIELIAHEIEGVNRSLPAQWQIKRFVNLHKEFDVDEGELTRTRKVRRVFVEERYKDLIQAVYSGNDEAVIEAAVVYEDGRTRTTSGRLRIAKID